MDVKVAATYVNKIEKTIRSKIEIKGRSKRKQEGNV